MKTRLADSESGDSEETKAELRIKVAESSSKYVSLHHLHNQTNNQF